MCREQHRLALELKLQHEIQPSSYVEDIVECPISPETIAGVSPAASNSAELTSLYDCCADEMCSNGVKEEQIPQRFSASNSSNDNDNLVEVCDDEIAIRSVLMANEVITFLHIALHFCVFFCDGRKGHELTRTFWDETYVILSYFERAR
ncbi:unnamed protein product [Anisakis simplex]|uniref:Uncharacterized protein n=1 Tax=Anisakis simplex TaxID=6269 RepID=A0A0M3JKV0_ANISI|nr:unnamed protein product [Anisakis simplex]